MKYIGAAFSVRARSSAHLHKSCELNPKDRAPKHREEKYPGKMPLLDYLITDSVRNDYTVEYLRQSARTCATNFGTPVSAGSLFSYLLSYSMDM